MNCVACGRFVKEPGPNDDRHDDVCEACWDDVRDMAGDVLTDDEYRDLDARGVNH